MGKKKNKKSEPLKAKAFDIANYGVTKAPTAKSGTSSTSFTGGTPDWDKVTSAKTHMENTMKLQEQNRRSVADKKAARENNEEVKETTNKEEVKTTAAEEKATVEGETPVEVGNEEVKDEKEKEGDVEDNVVEDDVVEDDPVELSEKELTSDVYNVKTATKLSLANLFKNGKLRKGKPQHSKEVQARMKANYRSAKNEIAELKRDKKNRNSEASKKKIEELEKIVKKNNYKSRNINLLTVTLPNGEKEEMTAERFETEYAEMFELRDKGGRKYKGGSSRGGRDYMSPIEETPMNFRSPFARRSRGYLKIRENWTPQQSVPMNHGSLEDFQLGRNGHNPDTMSSKHEDWHAKQSGEKPPMNYGSPLHQGQTDIKNQQFGSIWDKVQAYGSDMDEKVDKFIQHVSYDPNVEKPIKSMQNQEWVVAITKWLQEQKSAMVKARTTKNSDEQQRVAAAVNTLIQDVVTYSGKFLSWMDRNSGDQTEGNAGGSVVSQGSKKDERFIGNITFMGDKNTTVAVSPEGKIGIKSYGLDGVKFVEDLDDGVFAKDDMGFLQFTKISEQLQKDAESGKPLNENVVKGNADQLLKNKDSVLSWAFDPLYGQSWLQDYAQANPDADVDVFMPESPAFDIDYLTDELHGWLTSKLTESYNKNTPQQPEQKGDAAQGIMDQTLAGVEEEKKNKQGVYAEGGEQPQQPVPEEAMAQGPEQGTPMTYKKRSSYSARELLRKYTK